MSDQGEASRPELRLCLVLNGGISLAVWMSGVTTEIDNLRVCSALATDDDRVLAAWQAILARSPYSAAIVDVIAGTSAGGLNGTALALATSRNQRLPRGAGTSALRDLWLDAADLSVDRLIQAPSAVTAASTSLLDGDFFLRTIRQLLNLENPVTLDESAARDCTLLLTATALTGAASPSPGDQIGGADSRRVYRFRRRRALSAPKPSSVSGSAPAPLAWDEDDFTLLDELALASRASATFPGAFTPVAESNALVRLRREVRDDPKGQLADGGVLDNAPFEPLLAELRERPIDEPWHRLLIYVKPDPSSDLQPPRPATVPPTVGDVLSRVLSAFRQPDARLDWDTLQHAAKLARLTESPPSRQLDLALQDVARRSPGEPAPPDETGLAPGLLTAADALISSYIRGRSQAAAERWLPRDLGLDPDGIPPVLEANQTRRYIPTEFAVPSNGRWFWGIAPADRILRWWGRLLADRAARDPADDGAREALRVVGTGQRQVTLLLESLETDLWEMEGPDALARWFTGSRRRRLDRIMREGAAEVARAVGLSARDGATDLVLRYSLAVEVVMGASGWTRSNDTIDPPRFDYRVISPNAPSLIELGDIEQGNQWPARKLYGTQWGHFGAFASVEARRHDWLWGRLDAASMLSSYLLASRPEDVTPAAWDVEVSALQAELRDAILAEEIAPSLGASAAAQRITVVREEAAQASLMDAGSLWRSFRDDLTPQTRDAIQERLWLLLQQNLPALGFAYAVAVIDPSRLDRLSRRLGAQQRFALLPLVRFLTWAPRRVATWLLRRWLS